MIRKWKMWKLMKLINDNNDDEYNDDNVMKMIIVMMKCNEINIKLLMK